MKRFKNFLNEDIDFLTEAKDFSTAMESVLGVAYAAASYTDREKGLKYLKKEMGGSYKGDFGITKNAWKADLSDSKIKKLSDEKKRKIELDNLMLFGENIKKAIDKAGDFKFQAKGTITEFWKKNGGKNNTSKTDIILGGKKCSVKNASGAQLMSGKKGESIATTAAAAKESGLNKEAQETITEAMQKLEEDVTEGYYASLENLKNLKAADASVGGFGPHLNLKALATIEVEKYNKALEAWESQENRLKKDKPKKPSKDTYKIYNDEKVKIKSGEFKGELKAPSDFPTLIKNNNEAFLEKAEGIYKENADAVAKALGDSFDNNDDFKLAFVYEAATGSEKFGDNTEQRANYLLCWEKQKTIQNFKIKVYPVPNRNSEIIKTYAKQIDLIVNWKSSSTSSHDGYNVWQNVRLVLKKIIDNQEKSVNESYNIIEEYKQQLNEGYLSEFAFWDKVKEVTKNLFDKAKKLWNQFTTWFASLIEKIKDAAADGIKALSNIMGLELNTKDTLRNNKKLRVRLR